MSYALKVADRNAFVKAYYVDSQSKDRNVHVVYTELPDTALTFDDINDAALHLTFIYANVSSTDVSANSLCIAEAQIYYKEL